MTGSLDDPAGLVQRAGAFIFDFDGTLYNAGGFTRRFLFSPLFSAKSGPAPVDPAAEKKWSLADILLAGEERRVRRTFAGCDYGDAETYYGEFFAALERRTGRSGVFLRSWYFRRYLGRMTETLRRFYPARPGAAILFNTLERRGIPRAVYSDYPALSERLGAAGLDPGLCGELFDPGNFGAQKPAARPFLEIARTLCRRPEEVLVVGDRDSTDGAGAAAAGMMFFKIAAPAGWAHLCALVEQRAPNTKR
ncbi:MAG: HAD family hydrolase [Spirochaetaceae bacterium]|jgi:beta-phosphoglucomutase-like phosphatase (HAD superfamily)|nr:HAD family hydrolase [Spirochaetaceae bacterium]